jgi:hypothetical protein
MPSNAAAFRSISAASVKWCYLLLEILAELDKLTGRAW